MAQKWQEKEVLKRLKVEDFRHVRKDQIRQIWKMFDQMEPETAQKLLDQFPAFADTMKELLAQYKEVVDRAMQSNDESMKSFYQSADRIIYSLESLLKKDNLSSEERMFITQKMIELQKMKKEKDTENKNWLKSMVSIAAGAVCIVGTAVYAIVKSNDRS